MSLDARSLYDDRSSQGHESLSVTSRSRRYSDSNLLRHRWQSKYSYISSAMAATVTISYFDVAIEHNLVMHLNFFMQFLAFVISALPLYYMQVILGQYTQLGVIMLRYVSPLGHGVAISFLTLILLDSIKLSIYLSDFVTYFMHSFRLRLEWLTCPDFLKDQCWNNQPPCNQTNCLNDSVNPSTYFYYHLVYMEERNFVNETKLFHTPSLQRTMIIWLAWLFIFLIMNFISMNNRKMIMKLWTFTLIILSISLLNILARDYNVDVIADILLVNTSALTDVEAWVRAINSPIILMSLGKGYHILHGSYIEFGDTWEGISILTTFINFSVVCVCIAFGRGCLYSVKKKAKLDENSVKIVWNGEAYMYFIVIPMALGLYRIPQPWTILYFLTCMLIIVNNQFLNVNTLEKSFCDIYPSMQKYSKYVSCLFCVIVAVISFLISSKNYYVKVDLLSLRVFNVIETINAFLFSIFVCWVYGVQKFCDDVHYMRGSQPAKFWKVTWYVLPIVLGVSCIYSVQVIYYTKNSTADFWLLIVYLMPLPLWTLYEIFRFIKRKNVLGLFQSEEQFGPPDPRERYLRRSFNPRAETKLKRRSDICNHRCLWQSKVVKRATTEEETYKKSYTLVVESHS